MATMTKAIDKVQLVPAQDTNLVAMAIERGLPPEAIAKIIDQAERVEKIRARTAFDAAIAAASAEIQPIVKTREVSFGAGRTSYKFEDLATIDRTVRPLLAKHGLGFRFRSESTDKTVKIICVLFGHGHFEENSLTGPVDMSGSKNAIQAIGSTSTYLQRYTLKLALGLAASNDDDAQAVGASTTITDAQAEEINKLIVSTKSDVQKFLIWANVPSVSDLPITQFGSAIALLRQKQAKKK